MPERLRTKISDSDILRILMRCFILKLGTSARKSVECHVKRAKAKARKVSHFLFLSSIFFGFMTKGKKDYTPTGPPKLLSSKSHKMQKRIKIDNKANFLCLCAGETDSE